MAPWRYRSSATSPHSTSTELTAGFTSRTLPNCIAGLRVGVSAVGTAATPQLGLFTTVGLRRGAFIGFYSGEELEESEVRKLPLNARSYAMDITGGVSLVARPGTVEKDLLGRVNEPPPRKKANVEIVAYYLGTEYHNHHGPVAKAIAYYAAEKIEASSELFVYYGPHYGDIRQQMNYSIIASTAQADAIPSSLLQPPLEALAFLPLDCFVACEKGQERFTDTRSRATRCAHGGIVPAPERTKHGSSRRRRDREESHGAARRVVKKSTERTGKRPVGRPPAGKTWDPVRGKYV